MGWNMNTQSRKVNSIRNMIVGVVNQVSHLFLNTVLTTVFIRKLGTEYLGVNGLFSNVFVLLSFAEMGIGAVMVYSLYEPLAKKDTKKIAAIYRLFRKMYLAMAIVSALIVIGLIPVLKYIVKTELTIHNIVIYYLLFLISMIIYNVFSYKTNLLIADQKRYMVGIYRFIFNTIAVILQIVYLIYTLNYIHFLMISLLKNIVYSFFVSRKVVKEYPFIKNIDGKYIMVPEEKGQVLRKIKEVFSYNLAQSMLVGTDNIIISTLIGTVWVGYYSNYLAIITGVTSMVDTLYSSISASIGNLIVEERIENQYETYKITKTINLWIVGFTTTCLYILLQDFITLWLGENYTFEYKVLIVLLSNYYLTCTRNSVKVFREAAGMFEKVKASMIAAAIINIFLSLLLGKIFGVFGVLLATTISVLSTYYWYEAKLLVVTKFGYSLRSYFRSEIRGLLLTITCIIVTSIFVSTISKVTIGSFIIKMCICLVIPNVFYFAFLWREKDFQALLIGLFGKYNSMVGRSKK